MLRVLYRNRWVNVMLAYPILLLRPVSEIELAIWHVYGRGRSCDSKVRLALAPKKVSSCLIKGFKATTPWRVRVQETAGC